MLNNYNDQALNNWVSLFEDVDYRERKECFLTLMHSFNEEKVNWAIGCSMNLFFRGIVDDYHDIDLIVDIKDIDMIKEIMGNLGANLIETGGNGFCESDVYLHYQLARCDVDIIAGFRVNTFGTTYLYKYEKSEIDTVKIDDIDIPLISLEAMYILYYMMEGWQPRRKFKRVLVEQYLRYNRPVHNEVFTKALSENDLPGQVRWGIKALMKN